MVWRDEPARSLVSKGRNALPSDLSLVPTLATTQPGAGRQENLGGTMPRDQSTEARAEQRRDTDPCKHFFLDQKDKPHLHPTLLKSYDDFVSVQVIDDIVASQDKEEKTKKAL